jgi:hypothetical protein
MTLKEMAEDKNVERVKYGRASYSECCPFLSVSMFFHSRPKRFLCVFLAGQTFEPSVWREGKWSEGGSRAFIKREFLLWHKFLERCGRSRSWSWLDRPCERKRFRVFGSLFAGGAIQAVEGDADHGGRGRGMGEPKGIIVIERVAMTLQSRVDGCPWVEMNSGWKMR